MVDYKILFFLLVCGISHVVPQAYLEGVVSYYCDNKPADVVFVLDSSNSIWSPDFGRQMAFVREVTSMFQIGEDKTRVGILTYSTEIHTEFYLNEYYDKRTLTRAISRIRKKRGYQTNTKGALWHMRKRMFHERYGSRPGVAKVGIILTDGQSSNVVMTQFEARRARRQGIELIAIGIGSHVNQRELRGIASRPTRDHVFQVSNYAYLDSIKNILAIKTCIVTPAITTTTTTTTTPAPTTTTTSATTTTTSILDKARYLCNNKLTDIVFAFDSSTNVQNIDFFKQLDFAKRIIELLSIGPDATRVGAILYSDQIQNIFDLDQFQTAGEMKRELNSVIKSAGGNRVDEAIRYIRTKTFRRSVARRNAAQIAFIITGSPSTYLQRSKRQATRARESGITLIPIGIGDVNIEELRAISGTSDDTLMYPLPSYNHLESLLANVAIEACGIPVPAVPIADQSCGSRQEADIMFILDSVNAGRKNTRIALEFIKSLVRDLDVDPNKIQIGLMSAECEDDETGFALGTNIRKQDVVRSLSHVKGTDFSQILKQMRQGAFNPSNGGRKEARKIAILIVDGNLEEPIRALTEAKTARIHGIEVFVVQVGQEDPQEEIKMMCDATTGQHYFQVPTYSSLSAIKERLWEALCEEL